MNDVLTRQMVRTREPQYDVCLDAEPVVLGPMASFNWRTNPAHFLFSASRYKFVAKQLAGRKGVAEVGCGDAHFSDIVKQTTGWVDLYDFDPVWAEETKKPITTWDITAGPLPVTMRYHAVYMLDVLEHVLPAREDAAMQNICASLTDDGVFIAGIPSLEGQKYASPISKAGHVNCKSGDRLKADAQRYFRNVFLFSMNDEVVHTGFSPMAHYLFILCVGPKR